MTIENIKKEMLKYRDFYGGNLLEVGEIENATTKEELEKIIENHRSHMEAMLSDANGHLDNLKRKCKLGYC
jgi:hypothetical protein